ncbi:MAG: hypothetical protein ACJAQ6_000367 [Arenicella sp.]|jgi:hypothetical protein
MVPHFTMQTLRISSIKYVVSPLLITQSIRLKRPNVMGFTAIAEFAFVSLATIWAFNY